MVNAVLISREAEPRRRAPPPLLEGIRRADWLARPDATRRLGDLLADRGAVAYCVGDIGAARIAGRRASWSARLRIGSAAPTGAARRRVSGRSWAECVAGLKGRLKGGAGAAIASQT